MVFSNRSAFVVALAFVLSQFLPSTATAIQPLSRSESSIISGLLRTTTPKERRAFIARDACPSGYNACTNGISGCCPSSQTCALLDGKPRCCTVGQMCMSHTFFCVDKDYGFCPGVQTFCCPQSDTCLKDASGNPTCSSGHTGGVTVVMVEASTPPFSQSTTSTPAQSTPPPTTQSESMIMTTSSQSPFTTPTSSGVPTSTGPSDGMITGGVDASWVSQSDGMNSSNNSLANRTTVNYVFATLASMIAILVVI